MEDSVLIQVLMWDHQFNDMFLEIFYNLFVGDGFVMLSGDKNTALNIQEPWHLLHLCIQW